MGRDAEPTLFTGNASLTKGNHRPSLSLLISPPFPVRSAGSVICSLQCALLFLLLLFLCTCSLKTTSTFKCLSAPPPFLSRALSLQTTQTRTFVPAAEKDHKGTQREKKEKTTKGEPGETLPSHPFLQLFHLRLLCLSHTASPYSPYVHNRRVTTAHTGDLKPPQSRWSQALPTPCQRRRGSAQIW